MSSAGGNGSGTSTHSGQWPSIRPPDPSSIHSSTARNHNPGNGTREWKISVQAHSGRIAACPRCKENFARGAIRVGSAASGGKACFHMTCLDASLPAVESMAGWDHLSQGERQRAHHAYAEYRASRGGEAEAQAPKRLRTNRPLRQVQIHFAQASPDQTRGILSSTATGPTVPGDPPPGNPLTPPPFPILPEREAAADEDSDLDDAADLPAADGDPLVNMTWWDLIDWSQLLEHWRHDGERPQSFDRLGLPVEVACVPFHTQRHDGERPASGMEALPRPRPVDVW